MRTIKITVTDDQGVLLDQAAVTIRQEGCTLDIHYIDANNMVDVVQLATGKQE